MFYKAIINSNKGVSLLELSKRYGCIDLSDMQQIIFWETINTSSIKEPFKEEFCLEDISNEDILKCFYFRFKDSETSIDCCVTEFGEDLATSLNKRISYVEDNLFPKFVSLSDEYKKREIQSSFLEFFRDKKTYLDKVEVPLSEVCVELRTSVDKNYYEGFTYESWYSDDKDESSFSACFTNFEIVTIEEKDGFIIINNLFENWRYAKRVWVSKKDYEKLQYKQFFVIERETKTKKFFGRCFLDNGQSYVTESYNSDLELKNCYGIAITFNKPFLLKEKNWWVRN